MLTLAETDLLAQVAKPLMAVSQIGLYFAVKPYTLFPLNHVLYSASTPYTLFPLNHVLYSASTPYTLSPLNHVLYSASKPYTLSPLNLVLYSASKLQITAVRTETLVAGER